MDNKNFLKIAITEAKKSKDLDGYYVGAIIVKDGKVISKAHSDEKNRNSHAAEVVINNCEENVSGATIYTTI